MPLPTAPPNVVTLGALTVNPKAPSTVPAKVTSKPPAIVRLAVKLTGSLKVTVLPPAVTLPPK